MNHLDLSKSFIWNFAPYGIEIKDFVFDLAKAALLIITGLSLAIPAVL